MHGLPLLDARPQRPLPIPGSRGLPLIGHGLALLHDLDGLLARQHRRFGEVSRIQAFGRPLVLMLGAEANRYVLQQQARQFSAGAWSAVLKPLFEPALLSMHGEEHRLHREALRAAFSREALQGYRRLAAAGVDEGLQAIASGRIDLLDGLQQLTLDLACRALIGSLDAAERIAMAQAYRATRAALGQPLRLPLPGSRWRRGRDGRQRLSALFRNRVSHRNGSEDLLSRLCALRLDDGRCLDEATIADHLIFLMMAAHDTTSSLLVACVVLLGQHRDWQQRLREHAHERSEDEALDDPGPLDWVCKEALRLSAPVPLLLREALSECSFGGYCLPAGTRVALSPAYTHRMAQYWTAPERFDPLRFAPTAAPPAAFSYLPFGAGAHKCIGMSLGEQMARLVLHRMLRRWHWQLPAHRPVPLAYAAQTQSGLNRGLRLEAL